MNKEEIQLWMMALNEAVGDYGGIAALGYDADFWMLWLGMLGTEAIGDPLLMYQMEQLVPKVSEFLGDIDRLRGS